MMIRCSARSCDARLPPTTSYTEYCAGFCSMRCVYISLSPNVVSQLTVICSLITARSSTVLEMQDHVAFYHDSS